MANRENFDNQDRRFARREDNSRRDFDAERRDREYGGDDYFYGGLHSQREDWEDRTYDNGSGYRREGMYEAGGRDFAERARDAYGFGSGGENDWYRRSGENSNRYQGRNSMRGRGALSGNPSPTWTGGDRGWNDRRSMEPRHEGFMDSVKDFFGVGPKGYKRSDERVREEVCEALARHPAVDASDIDVLVKDGQVTLRGSVPNRWMRRQAEDALEHISGVQDVHMELSIARSEEPNMGASSVGSPAQKPVASDKGKSNRSKMQ